MVLATKKSNRYTRVLFIILSLMSISSIIGFTYFHSKARINYSEEFNSKVQFINIMSNDKSRYISDEVCNDSVLVLEFSFVDVGIRNIYDRYRAKGKICRKDSINGCASPFFPDIYVRSDEFVFLPGLKELTRGKYNCLTKIGMKHTLKYSVQSNNRKGTIIEIQGFKRLSY